MLEYLCPFTTAFLQFSKCKETAFANSIFLSENQNLQKKRDLAFKETFSFIRFECLMSYSAKFTCRNHQGSNLSKVSINSSKLNINIISTYIIVFYEFIDFTDVAKVARLVNASSQLSIEM